MADEFKLAVLTPAYNRPHLLKRVYDSLTNQTCQDFTWYIVDDGSQTPQEEVATKLINEHKIKIKFIAKENGGKHTALNEGLKQIEEPATIIVDNDDYLLKNAIEQIKKDWPSIQNREDFCGLGYLKCYEGGKVVGKPYTLNGVEDTFINERYNHNTWGDKCEVFKTEILKEFPFPVFEGERFLSESTVWCSMSGKYKFKFFNIPIYVCEYLEGGLSGNVQKTLFNNPKGAELCYKVLSGKDFNLKNRIKYTLLYIVHSRAAKNKFGTIIKQSNSKFLTFLLLPFGMIIYLKRKKDFSKS